MSTVTLQRTASAADVGAPRVGFWRRLWLALEAQGQRRAAAELRRLAIHHRFSDPEMSRRLHSIANDI